VRALWTHNFPPHVPNAGRFMFALADGVRSQGMTVDLLYLGNLRMPGTMVAARREVARRAPRYDVVHAQFGSACGLVTAAAPGAKVLSLRGSDWHRYRGPDLREWRAGVLGTTLSRWSIRAFDTVITMSDRMSRSVRDRARHADVVTLPDPVDRSAFHPRGRGPRGMVQTNRGDRRGILFTTLSTANPVKRVDLARRAVAAAQAQRDDLEMRIASGLSHDQMPEFVAACDVALCTSTHEGWPNSIKEALACGIPFVSTDVGDLAEIARQHPICRICEPDPVALGAAICDVLCAEPDETLPDAVASMDLETTSRRLVDVYARTLNRARSE
jgi:glycosyltransferase involved in cell wall biosynthesis